MKKEERFFGWKEYRLFAMNDGYIKNFTTSSADCTIEQEIAYKGRSYDIWLVEKDHVITYYREESGKYVAFKQIKGTIVEDRIVEGDEASRPFDGNICSFQNWKIMKDKKEEPKQETKPISTIIDFDGNYSNIAELKSYILDNREDYEGYRIRSRNNWDSDVIYRWQELDNGKIIWRKEKA